MDALSKVLPNNNNNKKTPLNSVLGFSLRMSYFENLGSTIKQILNLYINIYIDGWPLREEKH